MKTIGFSQNTWNGTITEEQLKQTNLIFAEHYKLLKEDSLLKVQLGNYRLDNETLIKMDSIRQDEIKEYKRICNVYNSEITGLMKELDKKNKTILGLKIGGFSVSLGLILWIIFK